MRKEEIEQAREMDLLLYLQRYEPEELVHFSGNTYCTRTHDSLKISQGMWYWWSQGFGGRSALDYLVKVKEIPFRQAVEMILGRRTDGARGSVRSRIEQKKIEKQAFVLPPRHADNRRVFAYLSRSRGIDAEIINHCIKAGQLYEDAKHHNCVFVGYDGETPKYAMLRGTLTDSAFVGEVAGSDKRFTFTIPRQLGERPSVCLFESAIDAMSYLSILKMQGQDWRQAASLSMGGIYRPREGKEIQIPPPLEHYLEITPGVKKLILCLDNDEAGRGASQALKERLGKQYEVVDNPPDHGKDYNEKLQQMKGLQGRAKTRGKSEKGMER